MLHPLGCACVLSALHAMADVRKRATFKSSYHARGVNQQYTPPFEKRYLNQFGGKRLSQHLVFSLPPIHCDSLT